jgi:deoxyribodipyrimidine photo-lyase
MIKRDYMNNLFLFTKKSKPNRKYKSKTKKIKKIKNKNLNHNLNDNNNNLKKIGFHIFHSDLSLIDNTALNSDEANMPIIPIFIYTNEQIKKSKVLNVNSIGFLYDSLKELNSELKKVAGCNITFFLGKTIDIIKRIDTLCKKSGYEMNLFQNDDFSEYAIKRDSNITKLLGNRHHISKHKTLCDIEKTYRKDAGYYGKFTPFYNIAKRLPIRKVIKNISSHVKKNLVNGFNIAKKIKLSNITNSDVEYLQSISKKRIPNPRVKGGRREGLLLLSKLKKQKNYVKDREILNHETSLLSAHHKFGTITIRETYEAAKKAKLDEAFIRQLYWRDFYYAAALLFAEKYPKQSIYTWQNNVIVYNHSNITKEFNAWKQGKTGFPAVDAAMREIAESGYMHNRMRMLVASVLIKLMMVNWRKGERYFATALNDYDFCQNFGNWCNIVGNMSYSQPPFRVFNPWIQGEKYDKNCDYIKKWLPELNDVDAKDIHNWYDPEVRNKYPNIKKIYPGPIFDYKKRRELWMKYYKGKI